MMIGNIRFRDLWLGTILWTTFEITLRQIIGAEAFGAMVSDKWFPDPVYWCFIALNVATLVYVAIKKEKK